MKETTRQDYSLNRLNEFKKLLSESEELNKQGDFCIYTTGSYGRLEACEHSDLDLFFLSHNGSGKFSKISKTLIDADIIRSSRKMNLPEFSGDGEYLEIHSTDDIYSELGSRKDDYNNFFTARMLLLLESKPIHNETLYDEVLKTTIKNYYKDFHEHEKNFQPVFLVNDVIRFWKTMCLNYEHNRNRKAIHGLTRKEVARRKNEAHIKNLKLKFSRKLTCYSFLLSVLYSDNILTEEKLLKIIKSTPFQRIKELSQHDGTNVAVDDLISLYIWFLEKIQVPKESLLAWISRKRNRDLAFDKSRKFARIIFDLMMATKNRDNLMYFLI